MRTEYGRTEGPGADNRLRGFSYAQSEASRPIRRAR